VLDRVRAGLGQRQLQVGELFVRERAQAREARQGETAEQDVLGFRRERQADRPTVAVAAQNAT